MIINCFSINDLSIGKKEALDAHQQLNHAGIKALKKIMGKERTKHWPTVLPYCTSVHVVTRRKTNNGQEQTQAEGESGGAATEMNNGKLGKLLLKLMMMMKLLKV
eukprot:Pgem_evm1s7700